MKNWYDIKEYLISVYGRIVLILTCLSLMAGLLMSFVFAQPVQQVVNDDNFNGAIYKGMWLVRITSSWSSEDGSNFYKGWQKAHFADSRNSPRSCHFRSSSVSQRRRESHLFPLDRSRHER